MAVIKPKSLSLLIKEKQLSSRSTALQALTKAALLLPGLWVASSEAAEPASEVNLQYARYAEGIRNLGPVENSFKPLSVDTIAATSQFVIGDNSQFAFNLSQDSWSGATPVATAPLLANSNRAILRNSAAGVISSGASPLLNTSVLLDRTLTPVQITAQGQLIQDSRDTLVMSSASPEIRKQADFSYRWHEGNTAWHTGLGVSSEPDFLSRFISAGGQLDFNQQHTTLALAVSYASNQITALLDADSLPYVTRTAYASQLERSEKSQLLRGSRRDRSGAVTLTQVVDSATLIDFTLSVNENQGFLENPYKATTVIFIGEQPFAATAQEFVRGDVRALMEQRPDERQQRALRTHVAHHVDSVDGVAHLNYQYTEDDWGIAAHSLDLQWVQNWRSWTFTPHVRWYTQHAADFYVDYLVSAQSFRHFAFDSAGHELWFAEKDPQTLYARTATGDFLNSAGQPVDASLLDLQPQVVGFSAARLPEYFSSDHRLASFGTLTTGLTVSRHFSAGFTLEAGLEYYQRASGLAAGGGGNSPFADVDAVMANVGVQLDLTSAARHMRRAMQSENVQQEHQQHQQHQGQQRPMMMHNQHAAPLSLMFAHSAMPAGMWMVGYRLSYVQQSGDVLAGSVPATDQTIAAIGCGGGSTACSLAPQEMTMAMHMVDFSYALSDRFMLMVMPQFMAMNMQLRELPGITPANSAVHNHGANGHNSVTRGDTLIAGLWNLSAMATSDWTLGLAISAPTGKVDLRNERRFQSESGLRHFDMQTGSGTWDVLPSLTYSNAHEDWYWGAQANATVRLQQENTSGYRLGNTQQFSSWVGVAPTPWSALVARLSYSKRDAIVGDFNQYNTRSGPMDFPQNQGGKLWEIGIGGSVTIADNELSAEWVVPIHERVYGLQLERTAMLTAGWRYGF